MTPPWALRARRGRAANNRRPAVSAAQKRSVRHYNILSPRGAPVRRALVGVCSRTCPEGLRRSRSPSGHSW
eukprot:4390631-Heterocapsa_arctica.AAC.1